MTPMSATGNLAEPGQTEPLLGIARRLIWWLPAEEGIAQRSLFIARVMTLGVWDDVEIVRAVLGEEALRRTLKDAPPGVFDLPSWHYWHRRFGLEPIPALPKRRLP